MLKPSDNIIKTKNTSQYAVVIAVAKRAREITQELIDEKVVTEEKPVLLAIDEIRDHKINLLEPDEDEL